SRMETTTDSSASPDIFESLTQPQLEAVRHVDGPLLILAGPGSGKTRVGTHRIANLLQQGVNGKNILALTFTNKAADEMKGRIARLVGLPTVWMGTFHRFCARTLRIYGELVGLAENYSIYDVDDSRKMLAEAILDEGVDLSHTTPEAISHAISWAKNNLMAPEEYVLRRGLAVGGDVRRGFVGDKKHQLVANRLDSWM